MINRQYSSTFRIGVAAIMFILCYLGLMISLLQQWSSNSLSSYGFAVPLISGYIVWVKWDELKAVRPAPDYLWGSVLTVFAMAILTVGRISAASSVQGVSLILTLAGLVLLVSGREALRVLGFAIGYLVLMLPLWGFLITRFRAPSQHFAATIATAMLRVTGMPALQHGTTIVLPSVSLDVLPECSGINQLIALTTMALPAAYLWLTTRVTRTALLAVAVLVGYLSNGARIAILGVLTAKGINVSDPHALIHLLPGFVTATFAYLVLWGCLSYLARLSPVPGAGPSTSGLTEAGRGTGGSPVVMRRVWVESGIVGVMLCAAAAQLLAVSGNVPREEDLGSVPSQIAEWTVEPGPKPDVGKFPGFDVDLLRTYPTPSGHEPFLAPDQELIRVYRNALGGRVQIYVGYYQSQSEGKELTGATSHALQNAATDLSIDLGTSAYGLKEVVDRDSGAERGVVFWYDINGRVVSNIYLAKCYTLLDALTRRRTNGAVVMIAWETKNGLGHERLEAIKFARALLPVLREHLPS